MAGSVAGTIQGEAGSDPAAQFAVAATIYNRLRQGYGSSAADIVNQPNQYIGSSTSPNSSAQRFAQAIEDGTLPQYGSVGTSTEFRSTSYVADHPNSAVAGGTDIGGNTFNGIAPQYGGTDQPIINNDLAGISTFGFDPSVGNLPEPLSAGNIPVSGTQQPIVDASGNVTGTSVDFNTPLGANSGGALTFSSKPEQATEIPAKSAFNIPDVGAAISKGFNSVTAGFGSYVNEALNSVETYATNVGLRFAVVLFAAFLVLAAAWLLIPNSTKTAIVSTAARAA